MQDYNKKEFHPLDQDFISKRQQESFRYFTFIANLNEGLLSSPKFQRLLF